MKKLIDSDCTFSSTVQEALDLSFGDYNPFCDNNRDPGATGKDQCDGVRDLDKAYNATQYNATQYNATQYNATQYNATPYNAAAGIKSSVLQALLFAFASLLLFAKF